MAFIQQDTENKELSTGATGTSAISSQTTTPRKPAPKSTFTDIGKYVEANKPQVSNLTQGLSSNIQNTANQVKTGITTAQNNFNTQVNPEKIRLTDGQGFVNTALNKAKSGIKLSADEQKAWDQYRSGQGVQLKATDLSQMQQQAKQAEDMTNQAQSSEGRQQLLSTAFASPVYSAGQKRLDQLLLQSTPGATRQLINTAQTATTGLQDAVKAQAAAEKKQLDDINSQKTALKNIIDTNVGQAIAGLEEKFRSQLPTRQAETQAQIDQARKDFDTAVNTGNFNEAGKIFKQMTGQDLNLGDAVTGDYFTTGMDDKTRKGFLDTQASNIDAYKDTLRQLATKFDTAGNVDLNRSLTPEERALYDALADLAGYTTDQRIVSNVAPTAAPVAVANTSAVDEILKTANSMKDTLRKTGDSTIANYQKGSEDYVKAFDYVQNNMQELNEIINRPPPPGLREMGLFNAQKEADLNAFADRMNKATGGGNRIVLNQILQNSDQLTAQQARDMIEKYNQLRLARNPITTK